MANKISMVTLLLTILVISIAFTVMVPSVYAESRTEISAAKGLTILSRVAGFNLTKYDVASTLAVSSQALGNLPTENIRYTLNNNKSHIEILETFTDGNLHMFQVLENSRSFKMKIPPAAVKGMAKSFLRNYQAYSANSFYGQLSSMLNKADPTKNSTTITGNIKFDITTTSGNSAMGNSTIFTWSYTSDGINATNKCVSLGFKDGFLKNFIDTWNLYKIGSTIVNVSKQVAEEIAMKNAKTYTYSIGTGNQTIVINNFNVTRPMVQQLMFVEAGNASNARDSDQLALYPMWRIGVGLDKYYPGNVYGIYVDIWADTGQIKDIHEVFSTLPAPANETATIAESSVDRSSATSVQTNSYPTISVALIIIVVGISALWWLTKKKSVYTTTQLPKLRKITAMMLCLVTGSVVFIALVSAIPTANAATSVIWGETSSAPYLIHTSTEISLQHQLGSEINSWFGNAGYAHYNYVPYNQTTKSNVLYYTGYYGQVYPSVETIYFDHGIGMNGGYGLGNNEWHYMVSTDYSTYGNPTENVFDYMIYAKTSNGKNHFSFINTCLSGNLDGGSTFGGTGTYGPNPGGSEIIGMPYAWTHGASMSTNGFAFPDPGAYIYIGFQGGSAALNQYIFDNTKYHPFVHHFFDGLLNLHLTVNQALDHAAHTVYPPLWFAGTPLYQGFTAVWEDVGQDDGKMVVYGNGDIYMYTGGPDYVTLPSLNGVPNPGLMNTEYQFSASATDPYGYQLWYTFNWGDGSNPTVTNYPINVPHTWTQAGAYTITVTAQSQNGISSRPSYATITINNPNPVYHDLTVYAYDVWVWNELHPTVYIDGVPRGTAPLTVSVLEGWHDVQVDDWIWNEFMYWDDWLQGLWYDDGYTYYGWGPPVPVYHNQYATAMYAP